VWLVHYSPCCDHPQVCRQRSINSILQALFTVESVFDLSLSRPGCPKECSRIVAPCWRTTTRSLPRCPTQLGYSNPRPHCRQFLRVCGVALYGNRYADVRLVGQTVAQARWVWQIESGSYVQAYTRPQQRGEQSTITFSCLSRCAVCMMEFGTLHAPRAIGTKSTRVPYENAIFYPSTSACRSAPSAP
jgi:hypothetical protein